MLLTEDAVLKVFEHYPSHAGPFLESLEFWQTQLVQSDPPAQCAMLEGWRVLGADSAKPSFSRAACKIIVLGLQHNQTREEVLRPIFQQFGAVAKVPASTKQYVT